MSVGDAMVRTLPVSIRAMPSQPPILAGSISDCSLVSNLAEWSSEISIGAGLVVEL